MIRPLDFRVSNFFARIDTDACNRCGRCEIRCQVDAVSMIKKQKMMVVDIHRCIGCGLCVAVCNANAISLIKKNTKQYRPGRVKTCTILLSPVRKDVWEKSS